MPRRLFPQQPRLWSVLLTTALLQISALAQAQTPVDLPLNRYQFIGSHNSYHVAPPEKVRQFIETLAPGQGSALNYTHRPLREQLERLNIRQLELDLYNDPKGGLYANPLSARLAGVQPTSNSALLEPGFKILHSPDFDVNTTVPTLRHALRELRQWSKANPTHEPVLVLLELKTESFSSTKPPPFDKTALLALEAEIRAALPPTAILTPDEVRGPSSSLREAITQRGWPRLSQTRGKFLFALDNENDVRDTYLSLSPSGDLQGRLCFVSVAPDHPAAAWMKRNDALTAFKDIQSLVQAGFMVRTRADADLKEVVTGDTRRRTAAMESGAQWISTDAPESTPLNAGYEVSWPSRVPYRVNPIQFK